MSKYKWLNLATVATVITILSVLGGAVVGIPKLLVTRESYEIEQEHIKAELAGVSINQQQVSARQNIKWLEADLRRFRIKYGNPPYSDPERQAKYEQMLRELEDEREYYNELRKKIRK